MERCSYQVYKNGKTVQCKRHVEEGKSVCWQHAEMEKRSPSKSPKKSSPTKSSPRTPKKSPKSPTKSPVKKRVKFGSPEYRSIPARDPNVKGGIAWAEKVSDLQAECIASVMDVYGVWDRESFGKRKDLKNNEVKLIDTCLKILDGEKVSKGERDMVRDFSENREDRRDEYREMVMRRENERW